jgi:hypothetical protein
MSNKTFFTKVFPLILKETLLFFLYGWAVALVRHYDAIYQFYENLPAKIDILGTEFVFCKASTVEVGTILYEHVHGAGPVLNRPLIAHRKRSHFLECFDHLEAPVFIPYNNNVYKRLNP